MKSRGRIVETLKNAKLNHLIFHPLEAVGRGTHVCSGGRKLLIFV